MLDVTVLFLEGGHASTAVGLLEVFAVGSDPVTRLAEVARELPVAA